MKLHLQHAVLLPSVLEKKLDVRIPYHCITREYLQKLSTPEETDLREGDVVWTEDMGLAKVHGFPKCGEEKVIQVKSFSDVDNHGYKTKLFSPSLITDNLVFIQTVKEPTDLEEAIQYIKFAIGNYGFIRDIDSAVNLVVKNKDSLSEEHILELLEMLSSGDDLSVKMGIAEIVANADLSDDRFISGLKKMSEGYLFYFQATRKEKENAEFITDINARFLALTALSSMATKESIKALSAKFIEVLHWLNTKKIKSEHVTNKDIKTFDNLVKLLIRNKNINKIEPEMRKILIKEIAGFVRNKKVNQLLAPFSSDVEKANVPFHKLRLLLGELIFRECRDEET